MSEQRKQYWEKLKADPERHARHKKLRRQYIAKIKADPERREEFFRKQRESAHLHRVANREELANKERERQNANRDEINRLRREHHALNPDKKRELAHRDYLANQDGYKRRARERKMRKINAPGNHTLAEWQALKSYYMDQCLACGEVPDNLSRDHVIPLVKGGSDNISNIQPLCLSCNIGKGTSTIDYRM